jgi:hypothetical protein
MKRTAMKTMRAPYWLRVLWARYIDNAWYRCDCGQVVNTSKVKKLVCGDCGLTMVRIKKP